MCIHEFYRSEVCGHHFPKLPPPARYAVFNEPLPTIFVPESLTCIPVKLALKFYHDQVVYLPADMNCGSKVEIPRSCPIVHDLPEGTSRKVMNEAWWGQLKACSILWDAMRDNGLGFAQAIQIQLDAQVPDRCSNRAKPGEHNAALLRRHKRLEYPPSMHAHVQAVRTFQGRDRRHMVPNVRYIQVDFGCGGPFSANCLKGWDSIRLLTHRLHLWGDGNTHPKPCNQGCLAGWSGSDIDAYRRETWPGDIAIGWRDTVDYSTSAQNVLVTRTRDSQQWWTALDFSNISHRHTDQWKWNGSKPVNITQVLTNTELSKLKVPECVWVPVPNRLRQILTNKPKAKPESAETPEMADKRRRKAWDLIREAIRRDHPAGERNAVVEDGQITFQFCI